MIKTDIYDFELLEELGENLLKHGHYEICEQLFDSSLSKSE